MTNNHKPDRQTRRAALTAIGAIALGVAFATVPTAYAAEPEPMFMFVHVADDLKADAGTLRLVNVNQQVLYFSDRPARIAGHMKLGAYLEEWTKGKDNFGEDPPNATLSVFEPGQPENTLAVVELTDPKVDGADLVYSYKLLDGTVPKEGGATTLFIDAIGIGGGVGLGYHGVGVGARGPGVL
ncbi:MAG TPA: hypothetical protein VFK86_09575 [Bauldia sp.]|nr:hypothetical protein [Bauldia sp.]